MRQAIDNDATSGIMRDCIMECFRRMHKRLDICEQCGITGVNMDIHHTKYDGATVYDLQIVCRSCNQLAVNKGLK